MDLAGVRDRDTETASAERRSSRLRGVANIEIDLAGIGRVDLFLLFAIAALPLAAMPGFYGGNGYIPKVALVLLVAACGAAPLILMVSRRDRPAIGGLAFIVVAWVSTALSRHPWPTIVGQYTGFTSTILLTAFVAAWSAGRAMQPQARRWVPAAAASGALISSAIIWCQQAGIEVSWVIPAYEERPGGLVGNPVYAGAYLASALTLLVASLPTRRGSTKVAPLGLLATLIVAGALNITGGRASLFAGLVGVCLALRLRPRRQWLPIIAAVVIGFAASLALASLMATSTSAAGRVSEEPTAGFSARTDMWRVGLDAVQERPLLGFGPGRFAEATSLRIPEAFAAHEAPGKVFEDAHNVVVELLVSVGVLGLLAALSWLIPTALDSRGGPAVAALVYGFVLLLEPVEVTAAWPLLLLGLSGSIVGPLDRSWAWLRRASIAGGAGLAAVTLLAAAFLFSADTTKSVDAARRANALLPPLPDPVRFELRARAAERPAEDGPALDRWIAEQERLAHEVTRTDPTKPTGWFMLGELALDRHDPDDALHYFQRALETNPQAPGILLLVQLTAERTGDDALARSTWEHRCRIDPAACDTPPG